LPAYASAYAIGGPGGIDGIGGMKTEKAACEGFANCFQVGIFCCIIVAYDE
jgi:hypothetical protein